MFSKFRSRIGRSAVAGFVCGAVVAGVLFGSGIAHAQDNRQGFDGTPCVHDGVVYPHGDEITIGGKTYVCSFGTWVEKAVAVVSSGDKVDGGSVQPVKHFRIASRSFSAAH